MVPVQFTRTRQVAGGALYAPGEVAAFREDVAATLVRTGVAVPVETIARGPVVPEVRDVAIPVATEAPAPTPRKRGAR